MFRPQSAPDHGIQCETKNRSEAFNAAPHDRAPVQSILRRFREYAHRTGHPGPEFFCDFDGFNNDSFSETKFASALAEKGLVFSKREMKMMREFSGVPRHLECVNYM
jgi:hypothetical protein